MAYLRVELGHLGGTPCWSECVHERGWMLPRLRQQIAFFRTSCRVRSLRCALARAKAAQRMGKTPAMPTSGVAQTQTSVFDAQAALGSPRAGLGISCPFGGICTLRPVVMVSSVQSTSPPCPNKNRTIEASLLVSTASVAWRHCFSKLGIVHLPADEFWKANASLCATWGTGDRRCTIHSARSPVHASYEARSPTFCPFSGAFLRPSLSNWPLLAHRPSSPRHGCPGTS